MELRAFDRGGPATEGQREKNQEKKKTAGGGGVLEKQLAMWEKGTWSPTGPTKPTNWATMLERWPDQEMSNINMGKRKGEDLTAEKSWQQVKRTGTTKKRRSSKTNTKVR